MLLNWHAIIKFSICCEKFFLGVNEILVTLKKKKKHQTLINNTLLNYKAESSKFF